MSLETALDTVCRECLGIKTGETVLVVTDPPKRSIAEALVDRARSLGAEVVLAEMSERQTHGTEPPPPIAAALLECDVYIAPTSKSISHTEARKQATDKGIRGATMPDITEDILERTMSADYAAIRQRSRALADALTNGEVVRITSAAGTDVTIPIGGRRGLSDDGDLTAPAAFGNLPAGEGFIAPVEGGTNGRIVFDGSIWPIGILRDPLTIEIADGYAVDLSGPSAAEFRSWIEPHGREAFAVAELGIGTNDSARLTGNVLEDEKILGTIHVAFGDNHGFGGNVRVASHQDGIVTAPTVTIDATTILEGGRLLV
jgi:leucyl aminopeptidase (aminopeptidase T)